MNKQHLLSWLFLLIIGIANLSAQEHYVLHGVVEDTAGDPLIGASVFIKGGSNGIATGIDGKFALSVKKGDILDVRYIGYMPVDIKITGQNDVVISMKEDLRNLDEVVVVGYGTQKKRDLTGSVASVSDRDFADRPVSDVSQALAGKVAGLDIVASGTNPGDNASMLLRGHRSFVASNDPLIILDGVTFSGALNDINPYDIKSIDILKDASSTAIYGSQGANGVIIITTKRGDNSAPRVTLDMYWGFSKIYGTLPVMNGNQFAAWQREAARAMNRIGTDDELNKTYLDKVEYDNLVAGNSVNWQDMLYQTGFQQKYQLGVAGGTEKVQYNITGNFFSQEGVIPTRKFERFSVHPNVDVKISPTVKVGMSTLLSYNRRHSKIEPGMAAEDAIFNSPLGSPRDEDGNINFDPANDGYRRHPLSDFEYDSYRWEDRRYSGYVNLYADWQILPVLKYHFNFGADAIINNTKESTTPNSIKGSRAGRPTAAYLTNREYTKLTVENILTFDKEWNDMHHLTVTGIHSYQTYHGEQNYIGAQDIPYDDSRWYNIGTASTINGYDSALTEWKLLSFAGRAFYSFNDRYLLTLSMRADGASQFSPNHKWGYFPSAALGWRLSEESFFENTRSWLSNLKLRLSYGVTGNQGISPYQTQGNLKSTVYGFDEASGLGMRPGELANKDLKWESTKVYNLGIDFGFFNNRLSGNIEMYLSRTSDLLMYRYIPITTGFERVLSNVGSTKNKGIEVALHSINIDNRNFNWTTNATFALNREKIDELYNGKVDDIGNKWFIGQPINVFYNYKKIGLWQLGEEDEAAKYGQKPGQVKLLDVDGNNKYTDDDRMILGSTQPKFVLDVVNSLRWRDWDMSFDVYVRCGNMMSVGYFNQPSSGRLNKLATLDYWTPENPTNSYPRPTDQYESDYTYGSTLTYRSGTYVRLKTLTLGYTLPKSLMEKFRINSARIYCTADNLWYWSKAEFDDLNMDPEYNGSTRPATRTFIFGLNVSF